MGSKSRIAKYIIPIIQDYIETNNIKKYIEPFVGGANVIDKIKCDYRYGFDKNKYLIALLQRVQNNLPLYEDVSKDLYDKARTSFNNSDTSNFEDWEIGNIGFIASFNGRWFDGGYAKTGYENTKNGQRLRNYYQEAKNNILSQANALKDIVFRSCDYKESVDLAIDSNTVIYCDPPYAGTKQYANAINFSYDDFWQTMREWSKKNIVIVSEQNAPDDFKCIWEQEVSRSIKANDKSKSTEKLFVYNNKLKQRKI